MHKVAPQIQERLHIPIIHIAEATAERLIQKNLTKVALLGTKYTMRQNFYKDKLFEVGIEVVIPNDQDIELVNQIIYDELCHVIITKKAKADFLRIINDLTLKGAQGVILGCTEIGLLIKQTDTPLPVFDTTEIHATKAAMLAINS